MVESYEHILEQGFIFSSLDPYVEFLRSFNMGEKSEAYVDWHFVRGLTLNDVV